MARILREYYDYIIRIQGIEGKNKLATLTKMSSIVAPLVPDTPENIKLFRDAIQKITGKEAPEVK